MSKRINARSPYYTATNVSVGQEVEFNLYIWTGDEIPSPYPDAAFTEVRTATAKDNGFMKFEMSELIRDYIVTDFGNYSTDVVWLQWSVIKDGGSPTFSQRYTACDGYGYFEEGSNPELSNQLLQSNTILYYNINEDIIIPIWAEDLSTISAATSGGSDIEWELVTEFWSVDSNGWGYIINDIVVTDNGNTNQKIQYIRITNSGSFQDDDTITITSGVGGPTTVIKLVEICEPKYDPINVIFYNKFGALQNMWFFKKKVRSIDVQGDSYKANILGSGVPVSYSTTSHQKQAFNVNGSEKVNLNSGFYDEQYNEIVQQMLLSEQVWIDNGTNVLPVMPVTKSYSFQTSVNDKLINHNLDFEYAYDKINNIR